MCVAESSGGARGESFGYSRLKEGRGIENRMDTFFGGQAKLVELARKADARGALRPFYFDQMPFPPVRAFVISEVPPGTVRGGHAHRFGMQLLICLRGRIDVLMRHADEEAFVILTPISHGLIVGPGVWAQQTYVAEGSTMLVFTSEPYDPTSYIQR